MDQIWKYGHKSRNMEKYGKYGHKSLWIYKQNMLKMRFSCVSDLPESREKIWISIDFDALIIIITQNHNTWQLAVTIWSIVHYFASLVLSLTLATGTGRDYKMMPDFMDSENKEKGTGEVNKKDRKFDGYPNSHTNLFYAGGRLFLMPHP
jgi:hypothetical protein